MTKLVRARRRSTRLVATAAVVGLAGSAIVAAGGGSAAAADLPNAQSVGRFLDGAAGGNPIQDLADLKDARATAPGTTSAQNPLDATLLGQLNLPLSGALNLPGGGALNLGAANQVAQAKLNGYSYGASGAVLNSGGVSLNDDNNAFPANATINLSASALGSIPIPALPTIPGLPTGLPSGDLAALGGVQATLGAVAALAQTKVGGDVVTPKSGIADVKLLIGSPALGALLSQLAGALSGGALGGALPDLGPLQTLINALPAGQQVDLSSCRLTNPGIDSSINLAGGGVVIDSAKATITLDLGKLVKTLLDKDISNLSTSNFDLIDFLVTNLPKILSSGLTDLVTGITDPLKNEFKGCVAALNTVPVIGGITQPILTALLSAIDTGQTTLLNALSGLSDQFTAAATGPLGQLAGVLKNVVDIGLNVQSGPGIQPNEKTYPFSTNLEATPAQNTPVVDNQTLVRAIEIQLLDTSSLPVGSLPTGGLGQLPGLPGLGSNSLHQKQLAGAAQAVRPLALAPGDSVATLALGNAAAGPSTIAAPPSTTVPTSNVPSTNIPTGVPAGAAGENGGGLPVLPLVALLMLLSVAGGSYWHLRIRGNHL